MRIKPSRQLFRKASTQASIRMGELEPFSEYFSYRVDERIRPMEYCERFAFEVSERQNWRRWWNWARFAVRWC
jgi:hypothetical protein